MKMMKLKKTPALLGGAVLALVAAFFVLGPEADRKDQTQPSLSKDRPDRTAKSSSKDRDHRSSRREREDGSPIQDKGLREAIDSSDLDQVIGLTRELPLKDRLAAFSEFIKACDPSQLQVAFDSISKFGSEGEKGFFYTDFFGTCIKADPDLAISLADGIGPGRIREDAIRVLADGATDAAAISALFKWAAEGEHFAESVNTLQGALHGKILTMPLDDLERLQLTQRSFGEKRLQEGVLAALADRLAREGRSPDSPEVSQLLKGAPAIAGAYWEARASGSPESVEKAFQNGELPAAAESRVVQKLAFNKYRTDPGSAMTWIMDNATGKPWSKALIDNVARSWITTDSMAASDYIRTLPASPEKDQLVGIVVEHLKRSGDEGAAKEWASSIGQQKTTK